MHARPHILFGDRIYHRVLLELRVDGGRRTKRRKRGGEQWVFPENAVALWKVWVLPNDPQLIGGERLDTWKPELEALPPGRPPLSPILGAPTSEDDDSSNWRAQASGASVF